MKKDIFIIIFIIICMILSTIIFIIINDRMYGTDKIYIADYMPYISNTPDEKPDRTPWEVVKLTRTISDMKIAIGIQILMTIAETAMLYETHFLKKDLKSMIIVLMIFIIPLVISGIKLSSIYGYTE